MQHALHIEQVITAHGNHTGKLTTGFMILLGQLIRRPAEVQLNGMPRIDV